jgi:Flp pilus assembly protein TadB
MTVMHILILAACGAGIGLGVILAVTPPGRVPLEGSAPGHLVQHLSLRRMLVAVGCTILAYLGTGWPVAVPIVLAGAWFLPDLLGPNRAHQRQLAVIDALGVFTESLRDTLAAAAGLNQALIAACRLAPEPLQPAAGQLAETLEARTTTTRHALQAFADQIGDPTCDLIALALASVSEQPTRDLAGLLGSLADTAREQAAMRTRTAVAQARTRTATRMITTTALGLAALLLVVDRAYLAPYASTTGQVVLAWIAVLFAAAFRWLRNLGQTPAADRLWTGERAEVSR